LGELALRGEIDLEHVRGAPEFTEFVVSKHYAKLLATVPQAQP
jgi:hypothetical protein